MNRDSNVNDSVSRLYLFVVSIACAAGAAAIYMNNGSIVGVVVLSTVCAASFCAAVFASKRMRNALAALLTW